MSIPNRPLLLVVGSLLIVGIGFTVWDYKLWRIEETKNYGQGWEENKGVAPAQKLAGVYTNKLLKFRIKYPQDWEAKDMTFSEPFGRAKITVTVEKDTRDLPIIADEMAGGITRERNYINTESASLVILTWAGVKETKQVALAKKEDRLYKIEIICESGIWKAWSATFEEIYRSLVLL
ncbi:MAG: hypothetical protein UY06_C0052G0005 [Candidatus Amesbacteria bacterium GW2011_GWA2_47_70]|uniref:Uncharacterized protein n=1 Tax=Candidatus Amesbacteria bacterium GW2011_GWC2_45_19 TaxID=1618366 RepID=A0A0G1PZ42_9BACT|nr:MAG: hypothetical protein UX05_C0018G0002 [Candidatus Amesbacteria bacterium GW2011_GWC2_45_19]KKU36917.1 MAG: hypothetical protein UX52_C0036G0002 [Candidatus Amesbacteria bacterium GW2011_GWA1_46_35]KKU68097.1 MAG: hypothetical protein UX93_C0011G0002 [Microgenomates group bacterium GW2011_GWC1_47_20]KKU78403.1 MAG: hypothetical protein UY06_C0052G0005 [Candidatus Amesbacteria bacterium GW2011_GWA2_47_70]